MSLLRVTGNLHNHQRHSNKLEIISWKSGRYITWPL